MKYFLSLSIFLSYLTIANAQYVNIPDNSFRKILIHDYPACFNAAGQMDTTCSEILSDTVFDCSTVTRPGEDTIYSIEGIQYFKNLIILYCQENMLTTLPSLPKKLQQLFCKNNQLISLPELPNNLSILDCSGNHLNNLPTLPDRIHLLGCSNNNLTVIPDLPAGLSYLDFSNNPDAGFPLLPAGLRSLGCGGNNLTGLPDLPLGLSGLNCSNNQLTTLPSFPLWLSYLDCSKNKLTALPALPPGLQDLNCSNNQLTTLPSFPDTLQHLDCSHNQLTTLPDIPGYGYEAHIEINCSYNKIAALPALPIIISDLNCSNNLLTSIPDMSNIYGMHSFNCSNNNISSITSFPKEILGPVDCSNNQLTDLPSLPSIMMSLDCSNNLLAELPTLKNISNINSIDCHKNKIICLPKLPIDLNLLDIDSVIACVVLNDKDNANNSHLAIRTYGSEGSLLKFYVFDPNFPEDHFPVCNPANNINGCTLPLQISGAVYYDNNKNNAKDIYEPAASNIPLTLSDGGKIYTNSNGNYTITADNLGVYSLKPLSPPYFAAKPDSILISYTGGDTAVTNKDFALQATQTKDSLNINFVPLLWAARPGFAYPCVVNFYNTGTTTLSPSVTLQFDMSKMLYDSSSNSSVSLSGNTLSFSPGAMVPGSSGSFIIYFTVKSSNVFGDSITTIFNISSGGFSQTDSVLSEVRGSFDPNDKQATPSLTPIQVANGKYINYTIRFQNTGNDTAFSVVIADTLNSLLQKETLEIVSASHNCKVSLSGNVAYFEFLHIDLPDSIVNEPSSHGYVTFRIRPVKTVTAGSEIQNKAYIYFDYNAPVVTNITTTVIQLSAPVPIQLISFSASILENDRLLLSWLTANEINSKNYEIQQSLDAIHFVSIGSVNAAGIKNYSFTTAMPLQNITYYRLKINDMDGAAVYSYIVRVKLQKAVTGLSVVNPAKEAMFIHVTDNKLAGTKAILLNGNGRVTKNIILKQGLQQININEIAAGTYYLQTAKGSVKVIVL